MNAGAVSVLKIRYLHWTRPPITGFLKNKNLGNWKVEIITISQAHKKGPNCRNSEENSGEIKKKGR